MGMIPDGCDTSQGPKDDIAGLVEWLRREAAAQDGEEDADHDPELAEKLRQAATALEEQERENRRLREALEEIEKKVCYASAAWVVHAARAALLPESKADEP